MWRLRPLGAFATRSCYHPAGTRIANVGFVSLSEALDLTTPSGRALAWMLAVFAEFERDILRDREKPGSLRRAKKAGHTGDRQV